MAEAAATSGPTDDTGGDDAIGSRMATITADPATEPPASPDQAADPDQRDDLLDAVMQDALAAQRQAIEEAEPEPPTAVPATPPKPASEPQPQPAADAVAVVEQPTLPAPAPAPVPVPAGAEAPTGIDGAQESDPAAAEPKVAGSAAAKAPQSGADVAGAGGTPDRGGPAWSADAPAPVEERRIAAVVPVESRPAAVTSPAPRSVPVAPAEDGSPAPVEDRTPLAAAPQPTRPAAAPPRTGESWLNSRAPNRYTLQLVGTRNRAAIDKFVQDHGISAPFAVFERQLNGAPWFSLVAGDYPNRDAAVAARARLPAALAGAGVWPRTFESIMTAR
jgi:DamX protein